MQIIYDINWCDLLHVHSISVQCSAYAWLGNSATFGRFCLAWLLMQMLTSFRCPVVVQAVLADGKGVEGSGTVKDFFVGRKLTNRQAGLMAVPCSHCAPAAAQQVWGRLGAHQQDERH